MLLNLGALSPVHERALGPTLTRAAAVDSLGHVARLPHAGSPFPEPLPAQLESGIRSVQVWHASLYAHFDRGPLTDVPAIGIQITRCSCEGQIQGFVSAFLTDGLPVCHPGRAAFIARVHTSLVCRRGV